MTLKKEHKIKSFVLKYFILALAIWTLVIAGSLWFNIIDQENKTIDIVKRTAQSNFNTDKAYRIWASSHGGVYVPPTEKTPPSPWLSHVKDRDIVTTDGKKLTLMNPAYMTKEMMSNYSDLYGIKGRIFGIKYLNPKNKATKAEEQLIKRFEKGEKEITDITVKNEIESFFLARPILMRQECQKCHGHLGFENGDIRGSVSISVPMLPFRDIEFRLIKNITIAHSFVWLFGFIGLLFVSNKARKNLIEKEKYIDEIKISSSVFKNTIEAILITDKNGYIIKTNNAFTTLTGYTEEEIIGKKPNILKSDLHDKKFYENFWDSILTKGSWKGEIFNKKKNGEIFISSQSISTIKDENKKIKYITSILHDITKQKEHEKQIEEFNKDLNKKVQERTFELEQTIHNLKDAQKKLIESEKMASLGGLVAGVAHEINTPVGVGITGATHFLEITKELKDDYYNENLAKQDLENYINTSEELATLIDKNLKRTAHLIRSFKQIAIDQINYEIREFYFKDYLEEILLSINSMIEKTNLSVDIQCDEGLMIKSYPGLFSEIFTKLIINSIKHGFEENKKGTISIEVTQKQNHIRIAYKDDGRGVSKENLKKIFDPFFTTNRDEGNSIGLGLNIIYNIVRNNLQGDIHCYSQEGEGIEFVITFDT